MPFTSTGTFTGAYSVELSTAAGAFPGTVLTTTGSASPLTATIPASTPSGTAYKVRVVNATPATTGTANSTAFTIVSAPTATIAPTANQTYVAGAAGSPLTVTETPAAASNTRVWQYANISGGPYTTVTGQTGTSYTPTFATVGTYYVVATSTFAACAAVTSNEVLVTVTAAPTNTISTPTFAAAPVCATAAAPLSVTFTASGPFDPANNFTVQLSDAAGSFAAPVTIGTVSNNLTTAQTIPTTIPAGTPSGAGYKIQVVSDNPAITSLATSASLTIVSSPTVSIAPTAPQSILAGANGTALTTTESFATGTTRVWQSATTAGGPYTTITGQTGTSYTPTFVTAGIYYVVATSTFAACTAVTSNEVQVTVNNPVPTITSLSPATAVANSGAFTLTVNGTNFVTGSTVTFNGVSRVTTYVSATRLTVAILNADITTAGSYNVAVANAAPGGGTTAATVPSTFTVTPAPLLAYNFTAADTPSSQDANVTGSAFSRTGVTLNAGVGRFNSTGWPTSTVDNTHYIQFTFAANTGYQADLTSLTFVDQRSASTAGAYAVRVSTDGFLTSSTTLLSGTTIGGTKSATLTGLTGLTAATTVTFRFYYANTGTYSVDDVNLYGTVAPNVAPTLTANPTSLSFTATTGQVAPTSTYSLSGANLAASAPISISSSDASVLVSLTGGAPFAQTATATASATGALSQTVTVQFTAPGTVSTTTATITNTDGSLNAPVTVTGAATAPAGPSITSFTPISGPVGTVVTITGANFTGAIAVAFNGTVATTVTVASATSIQATVPAGATSGTISVGNANGTDTSSGTFTVTAPPLPGLAAGLLLLEDDFNYTASTALNANGWAVHSGGTTDVPTIVAGNLTKSTFPTGPLAANANQVRVNSTGSDVNKGFAMPSGQTTVYYSALINVPVGGTDTDYFLHLLERTNASGTATQNFRAKLFVQPGATANKFNVGVSVTSNATGVPLPTFTTAEYSEGQTYLVVVKYVYATGGNDAASLFVFDNATPLPSTEPGTPDVGPLTELTNAAFSLPNGIAIRQTTSSPRVNIDGVRVATGWGTVVGNAVYTEAAAVINAGNYYNLTVTGASAQLTPNGAVALENNLNLDNGLINTSSANLLTLYPTSTVTGGSSTSFVNGPLARLTDPGATNPLFPAVFPIGKASFYRPFALTLAVQAAASTYTAEQIEGDPNPAGASNLLPIPIPGFGSALLKRVSKFRGFTLTSSNTTTNNAFGTVTLSFGAGDGVNNPGDTGLVVGVSSGGSPFGNIDRSASTGTGTGPGGLDAVGTLTSATINTAAASALFVLGATNDNTTFGQAINPLPVELTSFSAQRQADKAVAVKWTTASEKNSAYFDVQRSTDGREFATVATAAAAGRSTQPTAYAVLDKAASVGTLYYRLRQVDADGSAVFSPVVTVAGTGQLAKVLLYPNPARSSINFLSEGAMPYRVLNQVGQAVLHGSTATGSTAVALDALPSGLYFLELQTVAGRVVQKFEKE